MKLIKRKTTVVLSGLFLLSFLNVGNAQAQTIVDQAAINPADAREVIWVSTAQKAALLTEMRNFLITSQKVLESSLQEDLSSIEQAARPMGIKAMKATPEAIQKILPPGFTQLGPKVHLGFESIADEASGLGDREVILSKLANMQKTCIACHAAYRFEVK
jgi:hypothetical protein